MVENSPKIILILGAGFAGLRVAKTLSKKLKDNSYTIILVDKSPVNIYTPDLYEIASSFHQDINPECLLELKDTVASPYYSILEKDKVNFVNAEVKEINPQNNEVVLDKEKINYDYLVLALGSSTNHYGIPGLEQFSYSVKTAHDAIVINCHLDTNFKSLWKKDLKKEIGIVIGGGGATGVEFSGELCAYIDKLCKKYDYPREHVNIKLIQGSDELIGLGKKVSEIAQKRLEKKGVEIILNKYLKEAMPNKILVQGKEDKTSQIVYSDLLIWTGGVKINSVIAESLGDKDNGGAVLVNAFLQSKKYPNIFAAGDNAALIDVSTQKRLPMLAQVAWEEGEILAKNIINLINNQPLTSYRVREYLAIIPIAGKFGIIKWKNFVFSGFWCWIMRRLTDLWYDLQILPFGKALKKWQHGNELFMKD